MDVNWVHTASTTHRQGETVICTRCGRDINALGQDNMSYVPGRPTCEDCAS